MSEIVFFKGLLGLNSPQEEDFFKCVLLKKSELYLRGKHVIGDKYFQIFLQFFVLNPYLYKTMYFSSIEFINLSTRLLLHVRRTCHYNPRFVNFLGTIQILRNQKGKWVAKAICLRLLTRWLGGCGKMLT